METAALKLMFGRVRGSEDSSGADSLQRDAVISLAVFLAVFAAILFAFVVVPEILERRGHDRRSRFVRFSVWTIFLAIVLVPAALSGFLFTVTNPVDWLLLVGALAVAILWESYRLRPKAAN
jgi:uncharacterized BrkB/YihY/UPF0761 family membrane protein